jgi:acyl-CoA synthetase (AMP-forming)/AMP-acid ligase II
MDFAKPASTDPAKLVDAVRDHGCTNCLGSPTLWARIAAYCQDQGITLPTMRRVLLGGAPVPAGLLHRLTHILPNGVTWTPIGSTECGPLASMPGREIIDETLAKTSAGAGVCVGYTFADHDVRIVRITSDPISTWSEAVELPAEEIGEIVIRGPAVSPRYFRRQDATRRAKIYDGATFWHRTGDTGYLDAKGRLWFCGRVVQIIEHDGKRYFPAMAEGVFSAEPDLLRCGVVGVNDSLVLCVEFLPGKRPDDLAARLAGLADRARSAGFPVAHVLVHDKGFPVDARHNAKIEYAELTKWAITALAEARG